MSAPGIDLSFPHGWQAEILAARPLILPPRHFIYPREAEEVERGALEVLIRPLEFEVKGTGFSPHVDVTWKEGALAPEGSSPPPPFLATCALGFRDPAVPTGLWSTPQPEAICAVSGGYAYIIDTTRPERFTMLPYRPVLEVRPVVAASLLLFVGHRSILAWGPEGQAWESGKLSDEGVTITGIQDSVLHGRGWELMSDQETPFVLDTKTGLRTS